MVTRRRRRKPGPLAAALTLLWLAGACAAGPPFRSPPDRGPPTQALASPEDTGLGRLFAAEAARRGPDRSGFALLTSGPEAFVTRRALAALAERTLDVQYYVWEADTSGRLLLAALVGAADRGVRVRVLLDDINTGGRDPDLALVDAHPNVEVRLFNPFTDRAYRVTDVALDFDRVNHRMHNKAFVADNAAAVVGGRNVGDHYFVADERANFRDLDLLAAGPVVRELSASFDDFWNSRRSVPVRAVVRERPDEQEIGELASRLAAATGGAGAALPFEAGTEPDDPAGLARVLPSRLTWGEATVVADRPDKAEAARPSIVERLRTALRGSLREELLLEVAYFIPGQAGTERLCSLVARGVRVRVLTNSLASNDVALAHAGYAKYRPPLLRCGVELHELRPDARFVRREWTWISGRSTANLHTKAFVVDRHTVVVGSLNLDPRSADINTEIAVVVESPELARRVAAFILAGTTPENAYRLGLDPAGRGGAGRGLTWTAADDDGPPVVLRREPRVARWRALASRLLSALPVEGQL